MNKYSKGYYVLSKNSKAKQPYHWVLKAPNHEIILTSENYVSKHGALNGIESTQENCPLDKNYDRLIASDESPYFILNAKNGEPIGRSEMYSSEQMRDHGIEAVKNYGTTEYIKDDTSSEDGDIGVGAPLSLGTKANNEEPAINERPKKNEQTKRYA